MSHRQKTFGKYHHIGEFLNHYKKKNNNKKLDATHSEHPNNLSAQVGKMKTRVADVVEVQAKIEQFFGDQHEHYQFYVNITKIETMSNDQEIDADMDQCLKNNSKVFLAVRYGDNEGLSQPIHEKLEPGVMLHLQGQWITAEKAYAHDGEKTSVLHFTHHPVGFICVVDTCYS